MSTTTNPFQAPVSDSPSYDSSALAAPLTITEVLFSFDGRIGRQTYWLASIGVAVAYYGVMGVGMVLGLPDDLLGIMLLVGYIPLIWASLAIQTKRWHDRDKSGLWILIGMIPLIGPIWSFVECGLLPGTPGTNEYGRDPVGY